MGHAIRTEAARGHLPERPRPRSRPRRSPPWTRPPRSIACARCRPLPWSSATGQSSTARPSRDRYEVRTTTIGVTVRRVAFSDLPTRQVVIVDGPHPPVQLVTIAAMLGADGPCRPCPPRARRIGPWRSLTDNNGRQHAALTCVIGVASGRNAGTGRAFKLVNLVRAGSAWHREPLVPGGHKRSRSANQNRRSRGIHPPRPRTPNHRGAGFEPLASCGAASSLTPKSAAGAILPSFCLTDLHWAARPRITLHDRAIYTCRSGRMQLRRTVTDGSVYAAPG